MTHIKNVNKAMSLTVTDGLTVTVLPDVNHEFLMNSKEVAVGYGTTLYVVRKTSLRHEAELLEGKHFVKGVDILSTPGGKGTKIQPHQIFWTKRGIVRLGFFIKSERAKLFRDWAEELIIKIDEQKDLFGGVVTVPARRLQEKRLINRLDRDRLIRLLALTSRVDDKDLRISITNELTGGLNYGNL